MHSVWGLKSYPPIYGMIKPSDRQCTFLVMDKAHRGIASDEERTFFMNIKYHFG